MHDYEAPTVTELGTVADFTQGEGLGGNHDRFLWFRYGVEPS